MSEGRTKEQWESVAKSYQKHITRLQNEVEKMKCCQNCVNKTKNELEEPCWSCHKMSEWRLKE